MFLFDETLKLHINLSPLLVSSRVLRAAKTARIALKWNDKGEICGVSFTEKELLCRELGIKSIAVSDFMALARREPRIASPDFAEWLADCYTFSDTHQCFDSRNQLVDLPHARPAWFDLDDIDHRGFPKKITSMNNPRSWKFWTPGHSGYTSAAIRSFVTSSGTCSLDLGIPTFARHPKIMIREAYETLEPEILSPIHSIWSQYESLTQRRNDKAIKEFFVALDLGEEEVANSNDEFTNNKEREMWYDLNGKRRLLAGHFHGLSILDEKMILDCLSATVGEDTIFVTGHPRPDADAAVSALFEAVRRTLQSPPGTNALPCVEYIPPEVRYVLGPDITSRYRLCPAGSNSLGSSNFIVLVDTHTIDSAHWNMVRAIIDHHIVRQQFPHYVAVSQEVSWSSTIQVYIKILGSGMDLNTTTARILLEATKLEAEPDLMVYMSEIDRLAFQRLEDIAGNNVTSYSDLMRIMVTAEDLENAFYKDYKQTTYGFAVIKCLGQNDYYDIASLNNECHNLPLTVVKETWYDIDFSTVITETILLVFNKTHYDKGFRRCVRATVRHACEVFHGANKVSSTNNIITVNDVRNQTPRLLLMPLIEEIVNEQLRFVYSKALNRYISCGFFTKSTDMYGDSGKVLVCSRISFQEVKALLADSYNTSFMTLPQFWQAYEEFKTGRNDSVIRSLQDDKYVELLDTTIVNQNEVRNGDLQAVRVTIEPAYPALIRPEDGDKVTGIPKKIFSPNSYGDSGLWRYWSPDAAENVATRGHIFIMNQTCIDLKIRPNDRTANLTFRPIYRDIPDIAWTTVPRGSWVKLEIYPRLFSIYEM